MYKPQPPSYDPAFFPFLFEQSNDWCDEQAHSNGNATPIRASTAGDEQEVEQERSYEQPPLPSATCSSPSSQARPPRPANAAVETLDDAFRWAEDAIARVEDVGGEEALYAMADRMSQCSMSTAFSGIGSPEVASNMLHAALSLRLPKKTIKRPVVLSQVEWDAEAQQELLLLGEEFDTCLFGDIFTFFRDDIRDSINVVKERPAHALEVLAPVIASGNSMTRFGYCLRHKKMCGLKTAHRHRAGTSCTAYSTQGARGHHADVTIIYFLAWCGLRLLLQEAEIVQENVKAFPVTLLSRFLGHLYHIGSVIMDPTEFGWPIARERRWTKLLHKQKALESISPLASFMKRFYHVCKMSWRQYYFMHIVEKSLAMPDELLAEPSGHRAAQASRPCALPPGRRTLCLISGTTMRSTSP